MRVVDVTAIAVLPQNSHNRGYTINHKTVQRLMKELNIVLPSENEKYRSTRERVEKSRQTF